MLQVHLEVRHMREAKNSTMNSQQQHFILTLLLQILNTAVFSQDAYRKYRNIESVPQIGSF